MRARANDDCIGQLARVIVTRRRAGLSLVTGAAVAAANFPAPSVSEFTAQTGLFLSRIPPHHGSGQIRKSTCASKYLERFPGVKLLHVEVVARQLVQVQILSWAFNDFGASLHRGRGTPGRKIK
jgi:hypothetical protein